MLVVYRIGLLVRVDEREVERGPECFERLSGGTDDDLDLLG